MTRGAPSDLRHRIFRPLEQLLHFHHIHLRGGVMLMLHHLLDPRRIRLVEQRKGGRRMAQTLHDDARLLDARQEQTFGHDPVDGASTGVVT